MGTEITVSETILILECPRAVRALREQSESTQSTQRALREHLESTQRATRALKSESYSWSVLFCNLDNGQ